MLYQIGKTYVTREGEWRNDNFYRVINSSYMYLFMAYRGANKGIGREGETMTLALIALAVEIVALIWMIPILIKVNKIDRDLKAMNDRLGGEE